MSRRWAGDFRGFTLVELLVVIGIIAILIGILVPVLSGIASRGRDLKCQSNIRQCVQLILAYAGENKGQLPYGYYYARSAADWRPAPDSNLDTITLWSIVGNMSSKARAVEGPMYEGNADQTAEAIRNAAPFLRCPEATLVLEHLVSYACNMAAFVVPYEDWRRGARRDGPAWQRLVERPTSLTRCFPFTALVWDTAVMPGMGTKVGYVIGADIDGQRIWLGAINPQYRYYSAHDPFAGFPPGTFGNNKPAIMGLPGRPWFNIDPPPDRVDAYMNMASAPYQGNLRFRHNRETTCNVGFADGSVGKFTGKFRSDGTAISHDAIRKHFMVKWPSGMGIAPNPNLPH